MVRDVIAGQDWSYWEASFAQWGITCGRIAKALDQCEDAQVAAAGLLSDFADDSGRTVDSPLYVTGARKSRPAPAPEVGEHSASILSDFGVGTDTIADLQARGIIG